MGSRSDDTRPFAPQRPRHTRCRTWSPEDHNRARWPGQGNTADKIASAYDFAPLYQAGDEGAGQTIALIELEPNSSSDVAEYQTCYATNAAVNYFPVATVARPGTQVGEAALDIEQVIGLAPQATIDVYQTQDIVQNLIDDYAAAVDIRR